MTDFDRSPFLYRGRAKYQRESSISSETNNTLKPSRLRTDTLASSVLILIAVTLIQRTVGFGRGVLFLRWLSPETLGDWEIIYSFLLLAAPLAVLGVPGSFGRYLEHFRQRGHLRTFLSRTTLWTMSCVVFSAAFIIGFAPWFSQRLFNSPEHTNLIRGIALCLPTIIFHHTLTSLLTAMRLFRVVSAMTFAQSMLFAGLALGLLCFNSDVSSILIGYGAGCLFASLGALAWVWPELRQVERPPQKMPQRDFWPQLLRFAFFVWLTNVLTHLFAIIDRYMVIHYAGLTSIEARIQLGHYHSSRIIPLLLISFADLLSGLIMPHLSHDWEAGRKEQVSNQLRLSLKVAGLGMLGFGVAVLLFAPFLFGVVFQGKYNNGLTVLPWTLAGCVWYGIYALTQNYLWCAEKSRLATLPLVIGLVLNIALNLLFLPLWGLYGAVAATALSSLVCLISLLLLSQHYGLKLDRGTWLCVVAPLTLPAGLTTATMTLALLLILALGTHWVLQSAEQSQLRHLLTDTLNRLKPFVQRRASVSGNV